MSPSHGSPSHGVPHRQDHQLAFFILQNFRSSVPRLPPTFAVSYHPARLKSQHQNPGGITPARLDFRRYILRVGLVLAVQPVGSLLPIAKGPDVSSKFICGLSLMLTLAIILPANASQENAPSPAAQYQRLLDEYDAGTKAPELAAQFLELAEQHASDPVAV